MQKIKAVLDTNVIVSGIISPKGAPRKILELAIDGKFKVLSSPSINKEVYGALQEKHIFKVQSNGRNHKRYIRLSL